MKQACSAGRCPSRVATHEPAQSSQGLRCAAAGVLGYGATGTGFWLVHSAPRFPDSPALTPTYQGIRPYAPRVLINSRGIGTLACWQ